MTVTSQEQSGLVGASPIDGDAIPTARRYLRRNLGLMIAELVCFAVGMAFFDASTVLVSFVTSLTGSAILLGLMPTIFQIGAGLPQLPMARFLAHRQRKLPYILWGRFFSNVPLFLLFAVTWISQNPVVLLTTFLVCYGLFAFGLGAQSVAWMDLFARTCPPELRGKVLAVGRTIGNLVSIGVGFLVASILTLEGHFPRNYAVLFLVTSVLLTLAMLIYTLLKEPLDPPAPVPVSAIPQQPPDDRSIFVQGRRIWRGDVAFRRLTLARIAYVAHFVATPFYLRFARDRLGVDDAAVGLFVSALMTGQIVGNLAWGWLSARIGNRRVVQWSLLIAVVLPFYVLLTPLLPTGSFLLVYVAIGVTVAGEVIGWMNLLLDVSPTARRPLYISLHSTVLLPANLLPLVGGAVLTVVPYGLFFPLIAIVLLGSLWLVSQTGQRTAVGTG